MSRPEAPICCGEEMRSGKVMYSCPLIYEFVCTTCNRTEQIEGEGIKTYTLEESMKLRPELYEKGGFFHQDLGEEIE